tara:strand:- start:1044 stop:1742 length:699 start_codon:yes stop_codon:yes gene_type:complete
MAGVCDDDSFLCYSPFGEYWTDFTADANGPFVDTIEDLDNWIIFSNSLYKFEPTDFFKRTKVIYESRVTLGPLGKLQWTKTDNEWDSSGKSNLTNTQLITLIETALTTAEAANEAAEITELTLSQTDWDAQNTLASLSISRDSYVSLTKTDANGVYTETWTPKLIIETFPDERSVVTVKTELLFISFVLITSGVFIVILAMIFNALVGGSRKRMGFRRRRFFGAPPFIRRYW